MRTELIKRIDNGPITHLKINRPESGNSLSLLAIQELKQCLSELKSNYACKVIVLGGIGEKIFSSGHDLKEILANDDVEFYRRLSEECCEMMLSMQAQPQIIIAAVKGIATAAGCQLVAAADLAFATETALFSTPGVNIGLWCVTPTVAITRKISQKHAMEMLATGEMKSAGFAFRVGLINDIFDSEDFDKKIHQYANKIAQKSSYTLAIGKKSFYKQIQMSIEDAYDYMSEVGIRNSVHADAKEGIKAFVEKREPAWTGRSS